MSELVKEIKVCRACGSGYLNVVLDLGVHAVSDFYFAVPDDELRAPLTLAMCENCGLVQLTHSVDKERLYRNYYYKSGMNPAMVAALKDVVDDAMRKRPDPYIVLDIGANDGTLLDQYPANVRTIGVEPSNLCPKPGETRHTIYHQFYPDLPPVRTVYPFDIITSVAMFYDLDDPNVFLNWIHADLSDDGVWVNQMMDLDGMLNANAFDNVCHEHVGYWRNEDFRQIVEKHDLRIVARSRNAVNGGSVRLTMKHGHVPDLDAASTMSIYLQDIRYFANRIAYQKGQCLEFLEAAKRNGKTVCGYGASTKGNTLLQYYGITSDLLPYIAERNPDKWGKLTAGSHIPIISETEMRERRPDYLLALPWHFIEGFREREADLLAQGTKFVVPLPEFRVIGE